MKTITIKQDIIDSLDSDKSKLEFANSVIALLSGSEKNLNAKFDERLTEGLNSDLPEPMEGAPDFDPNNMSAPEVRRYSLLRAGYVPAGIKGLYCGYSEYEYKHLSELSEHEFNSLWKTVSLKIKQSKGKKDYVKFLEYLHAIYYFYFKKSFCHL